MENTNHGRIEQPYEKEYAEITVQVPVSAWDYASFLPNNVKARTRSYSQLLSVMSCRLSFQMQPRFVCGATLC
jgi:hypothetical protein